MSQINTAQLHTIPLCPIRQANKGFGLRLFQNRWRTAEKAYQGTIFFSPFFFLLLDSFLLSFLSVWVFGVSLA